MVLTKILTDIERIAAMASRWEQAQEIPDIERELVLDKLKRIYEEVMFLEREVMVDSLAVEDELIEECVVAAECASQQECVAEPEYPSQPTPEYPAQPTPEPVAAPAPEEPKLFNDEGLVRQRMDKQKILSLYGDPAPERVHTPASDPTPTPVPTPAPAYIPTPTPMSTSASASMPSSVSGQPTAEPASAKKVWGEMAVNNNVAFNDMLGKQQSHSDVASRLRANSVVDLRHSIGMNDRFLLLRELFSSDVAAYDEAIAQLNSFTDLDQAMIYIQENFSWNPDNEAALMLVDLLERKLEA